MKHLYSFILLCCAILIISSCAKEDGDFIENEKLVNFRTQEPKVDVCHLTGSGDYHTITINANALDAHLAHGDYEGECTNCDPNSCTFCDKLDYFDFDEPCDFPAWHADYYCKAHNNLGDIDGCGGDNIEGWAVLQDNDYQVGDCPPDPEGEFDSGWLLVYYETNGCDFWYGQVSWAYGNGTDPDNYFYDSDIFFGYTETDYDQAVYCASVIEGINAALPSPLVNLNCTIIIDPGSPLIEAPTNMQDAIKIKIGL